MLKGNRLLNRWYLLGITTIVVAVGGVIVASAFSSSSPATPVEFAAVSSKVLNADGIFLTQPQAPPATVASLSSSSTAATDASTTAASEKAPWAASASKAFGGAPIRESQYAHCVAEGIDQDCWAVSLDPSGLRSHGPMKWHDTFLVALVDPATDNVLFAEGGAPPTS